MLASFHLTSTEFAILSLLREKHAPMPPAELAALLGTDTTVLLPEILDLQDRYLLERRRGTLRGTAFGLTYLQIAEGFLKRNSGKH